MSDVPERDFRTEGCSSSSLLGAPSQAEAPLPGARHDLAQFERQQGDRPAHQPGDSVDQ
jgi:hypothetical protein